MSVLSLSLSLTRGCTAADLNTRPYITNLPATINVTEDQKTGFTLATLTFNDDTPQSVALEPDCSVDPVAESYKFTYEVGSESPRSIGFLGHPFLSHSPRFTGFLGHPLLSHSPLFSVCPRHLWVTRF